MNRLWLPATGGITVVLLLLGAASRDDPQAGKETSASRALANADVRWTHRRTRHADIYVLAGSTASRRTAELAERVERDIRSNLEWLGESAPSGRLKLFFVGSRNEMRPFTGTRAGGWSIVAEGTAFFAAGDPAEPPVRHETMHLLSWKLWGNPGGVWMSEGVATLAGGGCGRWSIEEIAAALYRDRQLVTIAEMRRRFRTGGHEGVAYYVSAASLAGYIDDTWGRRRLRELWRSGGMANSQAVLGATPLAIEREWRSAVARTRVTDTWRTIAAEIERYGCE